MLTLLTDRDNRCAVLDCYRMPHDGSMWCLKHYREFARELPAEAVADIFPLEVVRGIDYAKPGTDRNVVTRFPSAGRTIADEKEPLFDKLDGDDWSVVRKCLLACAVIGAFVAWAWWRG